MNDYNIIKKPDYKIHAHNPNDKFEKLYSRYSKRILRFKKIRDEKRIEGLERKVMLVF